VTYQSVHKGDFTPLNKGKKEAYGSKEIKLQLL